MTTKDEALFLKKKSFVNNNDFAQKQQQYSNSNLNLNCSSKFSNVSFVQSSTTSSSDSKSKNTENNKKFDPFVKEKSQIFDKSILRSSLSSSNGYNYDIEKVEEEPKKQRNDFLNSTKSNTNNSSTLSLHIAAYENSIEASFDGVVDERKSLTTTMKQESLNKKQKDVKQIYSMPFIQSPFEFPRQQEPSNQNINPEVMQFKASQKLSNPSQSNASNRRGEKRGGRVDMSKKAIYQLAFPKGTCVLRFSDLTNENITDTIWLIENHILIRKLELEGPLSPGKPTYFRCTNRYQGWFYDEPWEFMPLTAVSSSNTKNVDGALTILFPTNEMIEAGLELAEKQRAQASTTAAMSSRVQLEEKVKQLKAIKSRRKKGKKNTGNGEDDDEEEEEGNDDGSTAAAAAVAAGDGAADITMGDEEDEECLGFYDNDESASYPQGSNEMDDDDD